VLNRNVSSGRDGHVCGLVLEVRSNLEEMIQQ